MTSPARNTRPSVGEAMVALGGRPALIVSGVDSDELVPSDTVRRTRYVPAPVYVWVGLAAVEDVPSPKSHEYVSVWPSGSNDPWLEKVTFSGAGPVVGVAEARATGA